MAEITYNLQGDFIELFKLLKIARIAATGGHAKLLIDEGNVMVNSKPEFRKRAKIRSGDIVNCSGNYIVVK